MTCLTPMLHLGSPAPTGQRPRPDEDIPPKGRLVAVISTHNRLASLSRALDALLESTSRDLAAIVVVDNASSDQTWSMLCAHPDPRVLPIRMAQNQGGAGAFDRPVRLYSQGMRARLSFGLSMGIKFDTYLVDEVTAVGDAAFRRKSAAVFTDRIRGSSALVVNHNLAELRDYCDAALILEAGKLNYYANLNEAIKAHKAMLS